MLIFQPNLRAVVSGAHGRKQDPQWDIPSFHRIQRSASSCKDGHHYWRSTNRCASRRVHFLALCASRVFHAIPSLGRCREAASALGADPAVNRADPEAGVEIFELDGDDHEVKELYVLLHNAGETSVTMVSWKRPDAGLL